MKYLLALDQGTSSSRSIVFDLRGRPVAAAQREIRQIYPRPGWVEHDPMELWHTQLDTAREAIQRAGIPARELIGLGLTNQRETTLIWDRATGQPLHNAIVWQDRRTTDTCTQLRWIPGLADRVAQRTGLRIDAYFSATKLAWLLDHVPGARPLAEQGRLAFGTVDSWLLWHLTGGRVHATDVSNASRTMLFDIDAGRWDPELLRTLRIPVSAMPEVLPSSHAFGVTAPDLLGHAIPITGVAGDQQAALFGQLCLRPGLAKNTYGTGCFALLNAGSRRPAVAPGLVTTLGAQAGAAPTYAVEGSVFVGGAVVHWLRDGLQAISSSAQVEALAQSVPDSGGVVFVPAFAGLGAPYWNAHARGAILGLTRGSSVAHIARAALESIAYQSAALLRAMEGARGPECPTAIHELRVDGGASVNDLLMQFQADLLGMPVVRPQVVETTALGVAYLAGLAAGAFGSLDDIEGLRQVDRCFMPTMSRDQAATLMSRWEQAVVQATSSAPLA